MTQEQNTMAAVAYSTAVCASIGLYIAIRTMRTANHRTTINNLKQVKSSMQSGLEIDLSLQNTSVKLSIKQIKALAATIKSVNFTEKLVLTLCNNSMGDECVKELAAALKSVNSPPGLDLNLMGNDIGIEGAKVIADALKSHKRPKGLALNLVRNRIGDEGAKALASVITSGNCPEGLALNLAHNLIGNEGAKALADALKSDKCPEGIVLHLWNNNIGATGARELAAALASGKCPEGFVLNLAHNGIGDEGAKELAAALISGKCPERLVLNLSGNYIYDAGKAALKNALKSGKVPFGTKIVGLGLDQSCRDNDTNITKKTALLTLLSTKTPNLPIPKVLVHNIAPYLSGCVSKDEIMSLIKRVTHIQKGNTPRSISDKLLDTHDNLDSHPATLTSSLYAEQDFSSDNAPSARHRHCTQNRGASKFFSKDITKRSGTSAETLEHTAPPPAGTH